MLQIRCLGEKWLESVFWCICSKGKQKRKFCLTFDTFQYEQHTEFLRTHGVRCGLV